MMNKLDIFKGFLRGKRIAVLGIGISNRPLIRYISDLGGHITAFDKLPAGDPLRGNEAFIWRVLTQLAYRAGLSSDLKDRSIFRTPKCAGICPVQANANVAPSLLGNGSFHGIVSPDFRCDRQ